MTHRYRLFPSIHKRKQTQTQPISTTLSSSSSLPQQSHLPCFSLLTPTTQTLKTPKRRFVIRSKNDSELNKEIGNDGFNGGGGDEELKKDRQPPVFNLKWGDLLDPEPDNLSVIALTGLLAWATVQLSGQLVFISISILVADLKYSFIAALLLFILIILL